LAIALPAFSVPWLASNFWRNLWRGNAGPAISKSFRRAFVELSWAVRLHWLLKLSMENACTLSCKFICAEKDKRLFHNDVDFWFIFGRTGDANGHEHLGVALRHHRHEGLAVRGRALPRETQVSPRGTVMYGTVMYGTVIYGMMWCWSESQARLLRDVPRARLLRQKHAPNLFIFRGIACRTILCDGFACRLSRFSGGTAALSPLSPPPAPCTT